VSRYLETLNDREGLPELSPSLGKLNIIAYLIPKSLRVVKLVYTLLGVHNSGKAVYELLVEHCCVFYKYLTNCLQ